MGVLPVAKPNTHSRSCWLRCRISPAICPAIACEASLAWSKTRIGIFSKELRDVSMPPGAFFLSVVFGSIFLFSAGCSQTASFQVSPFSLDQRSCAGNPQSKLPTRSVTDSPDPDKPTLNWAASCRDRFIELRPYILLFIWRVARDG